MLAKTTITNKKQLIVAVSCCEDAPHDTLIKIKGTNVEFLILAAQDQKSINKIKRRIRSTEAKYLRSPK